ncbi:Uncharacterised protein [Klebsiella pneumoniae]|nr:Uncharacterised protein [Klebsiella pneumoniae]SSW85714.1 Uncharacterised protein [Klebsiella pneumoniae]
MAKAIAFAAVVIDIPERLMTVEGDPELALKKLAVKVAFAQGDAGQRALEAVVIPVVEHRPDGRARFQQRQVVAIGAGAAAQNHLGSANAHRFSRGHFGDQHLTSPFRRRTQIKFNRRLVITQRFQTFANGVIDARAKATIRRDFIALDGGKLGANVFLQLPG